MLVCSYILFFFFFNDTATTEIYTLSLHDALPILHDERPGASPTSSLGYCTPRSRPHRNVWPAAQRQCPPLQKDRKSTRLNSSHANISYAVFCLKKKKKMTHNYSRFINSYDKHIVV